MRTYRFIFIAFVIFVILLIFNAIGFLGPIKNASQLVARPLTSRFSHTAAGTTNFFQTIFSLRKTVDENTNLLKDNLELKSQLVELKEVAHENEILKKELGFKNEHPDYKLVLAKITSFEPSGFLQNIEVNRGSEDSLKVNQPVIFGGYLIGRVFNVKSNSATIEMITDSRSVIPVVFQQSRGTGLLRGSFEGLVVDSIPLDIQISAGEEVVTSGLGGDLPAGLPVGTVGRKISQESEIFQRVLVDSPVPFTRLEDVFILI